MLNKDEIKGKIYSFSKYMSNQTEDEIMQEYWEKIKEYIEQLETNNQKLIKKLEEDIKFYSQEVSGLDFYEERDFRGKGYYAQEILEIIKAN